MVNNKPKPIVEMQPILKPCFEIKRGHWKTCRAKNAPYLGRTSPYPPFHWVPPRGFWNTLQEKTSPCLLHFVKNQPESNEADENLHREARTSFLSCEEGDNFVSGLLMWLGGRTAWHGKYCISRRERWKKERKTNKNMDW